MCVLTSVKSEDWKAGPLLSHTGQLFGSPVIQHYLSTVLQPTKKKMPPETLFLNVALCKRVDE